MAEGVLRAAAGDMLNVQSAGSNPKGFVHPLAIQVMKEIDEVAIIGRYPERKELAALLKVDLAAATDPVMVGSASSGGNS